MGAFIMSDIFALDGDVFICQHCKAPSTRLGNKFSCQNPGCDYNPDMAPKDIIERNKRYVEQQTEQNERDKINRIRNKVFSKL